MSGSQPSLSPLRRRVDGNNVRVDSERELLVSKLCALLGRSEVRDLWDVSVLLARGGNLEDAVAVAPQKDAGFSAATLAWVLRSMNVEMLARAVKLEPEIESELAGFRTKLVDALLHIAASDI